MSKMKKFNLENSDYPYLASALKALQKHKWWELMKLPSIDKMMQLVGPEEMNVLNLRFKPPGPTNPAYQTRDKIPDRLPPTYIFVPPPDDFEPDLLIVAELAEKLMQLWNQNGKYDNMTDTQIDDMLTEINKKYHKLFSKILRINEAKLATLRRGDNSEENKENQLRLKDIVKTAESLLATVKPLNSASTDENVPTPIPTISKTGEAILDGVSTLLQAEAVPMAIPMSVPMAMSVPVAVPVAKVEKEAGAVKETVSGAEAGAVKETLLGAEAEGEGEKETEGEAEAGAEAEAEGEAEAEAEAEAEGEREAETETGPEAGPEAGTEADAEAETGAEGEVEGLAGAEAEAEGEGVGEAGAGAAKNSAESDLQRLRIKSGGGDILDSPFATHMSNKLSSSNEGRYEAFKIAIGGGDWSQCKELARTLLRSNEDEVVANQEIHAPNEPCVQKGGNGTDEEEALAQKKKEIVEELTKTLTNLMKFSEENLDSSKSKKMDNKPSESDGGINYDLAANKVQALIAGAIVASASTAANAIGLSGATIGNEIGIGALIDKGDSKQLQKVAAVYIEYLTRIIQLSNPKVGVLINDFFGALQKLSTQAVTGTVGVGGNIIKAAVSAVPFIGPLILLITSFSPIFKSGVDAYMTKKQASAALGMQVDQLQTIVQKETAKLQQNIAELKLNKPGASSPPTSEAKVLQARAAHGTVESLQSPR